MDQQGREQIFFRIILFFILVTTVTGIINLANSGTVTLGDIGSSDYMQTIPGQATPNTAVSEMGVSKTETFGTQDYTTSTGYNANITQVMTNWISGDSWTRSDGVGFVCSYVPAYPGISEISVGGGAAVNNVYDYKYHVFNQFSGYPFYTLVSGSQGGANQVSGFFIRYDQNSVAIVHSSAIDTAIQSFPYPYANQAGTVETAYDAGQGAVAVYVDDNLVGTFQNVQYAGLSLNTAGGGSSSGAYYVGIGARHWGMQLSSIEGTFIVEQPFSFWSDIAEKVNGLMIFGSQFLTLAGVFIGLSSNALVPFWIWAIFALPCSGTLVLIYLSMARGN